MRLEEFAITNYRTFTTRTVIPFRSGTAEPDAIVTFHGNNGSGKSNALVALDLFFNALVKYLNSDESKSGKELTLDWANESNPHEDFVISFRDRPVNEAGPTEFEARFVDQRLGVLRVQFTPAGNSLRLRAEQGQVPSGSSMLEFQAIAPERRDQLLTWIETPFGPGSYPCGILDSHRRGTLRPGSTMELLDAAMSEALFDLRTSLNLWDRAQWRVFTDQLQRFSTFQGKEVSIDRLAAGTSPELTFEERGKSILSLKELSSGEQQLVRLCALITLRPYAIIGIEEPELSLDIPNQVLFLEILRSQVQSGIKDQIILESHVPTFDSPSVIRFSRTASGPTQVTRAPGANESDRAFAETAQAKGAKKQFVTRDGYTQLPNIMLKDLQFVDGGHLWFLKGKNAWEAWREEDLATLLADPETDKDHE